MTHRFAASLLTAMAMAAVPLTIAPAAQAEVCGDVGGRHADIGGCSNIGGDIADAAIVGAAVDHPTATGSPTSRRRRPRGPAARLPALSFPGAALLHRCRAAVPYTPADAPCHPA